MLIYPYQQVYECSLKINHECDNFYVLTVIVDVRYPMPKVWKSVQYHVYV